MTEAEVFVLADRALAAVVGTAVERFGAIVADACAAAVTDFDAVAHLSFGDYTVREYFWVREYSRQINSFRGLRAHDIARAIGVFPAAVPVPEDAPLLEHLLGLTGRDPVGA